MSAVEQQCPAKHTAVDGCHGRSGSTLSIPQTEAKIAALLPLIGRMKADVSLVHPRVQHLCSGVRARREDGADQQADRVLDQLGGQVQAGAAAAQPSDEDDRERRCCRVSAGR